MTRIIPASEHVPSLRLALSPRLDGWRVLAVDDAAGLRAVIWSSPRCTRAEVELALERMIAYPAIVHQAWRRAQSRRLADLASRRRKRQRV